MEVPAAQQRYDSRRHGILAAAVDQINQHGMRGMTLAGVAGQLNLAAPAVIYYFGNKRKLIAAAFFKAIALYDGLVTTAEAAATPEDRLRLLIKAFFEWRRAVDTGDAPATAIFNDIRALNDVEVNQAFVALFRRLRSLLPHGPMLGATERNARAHLLMSQLLWAVAWSRMFNVRDYGRLADRMADILIDGVVAQGKGAPPPFVLSAPAARGAEEPSELFLRAATELINAQGYHGASVERISARLNLTKGAFYHYNDAKDALVAACFQRTIDAVWGALDQAESAGASGLQRLVSTCAALAEHQFGGEAPLLSTTALSTLPKSLRVEVTAKIDQIAWRYAMTISDGIADGSVRAIDVNVAAQLIVGGLNAAADLHFWTPKLQPSSVVPSFVRVIFEGLAAGLEGTGGT